MVLFWAILFFFLVRLYRLQRLNIETTVTEHQYRFYALRDKLREFAIDGELDPKHWVFLYLDSSLAKAVDVLPMITAWWVAFAPSSYQKSEAFKRAQSALKDELSKPGNWAFAEVHSEYRDHLGDFILDRHPIFKRVVKDLIPKNKHPRRIRTEWYKTLELQTEAPQTSTLQKYAPAPRSAATA